MTSIDCWQKQTTALSEAADEDDWKFNELLECCIVKLKVQTMLVDAVTELFLQVLVCIKGSQSFPLTSYKKCEQRIHALVFESAVLIGIMHSDLRRASLLAQKDPDLMHSMLVPGFAELSASLSSLFARGEQLSDWLSNTEAMADSKVDPGTWYRTTQQLIAALKLVS